MSLQENGNYEGWKQQFSIKLNEQQERAVRTAEGSVLLLAVPGSGKTTVLVARLGFRTINGISQKILQYFAGKMGKTVYADMGFPTSVAIVTEGNTETTAEVAWDTTSPASGSYNPAVLTEQSVTLNGTVTCHSNIDQNGVTLTTTIPVTGTAGERISTTIKAIAVKSGMQNSSVTSATYVIELPAPAPSTYAVTVNNGTCDGALDKLTGIYVDAANYTLQSGSTILTFYASYLTICIIVMAIPNAC